jgi:two-component system, response regulator PdtaR
VSMLRPLNVLIVEDDGIIAMDIEGTVESAGHNVAGWATSADQAVVLYDASHPDIVFLDIQLMNGTSGIDVARTLRERTGAKFVFMTANAAMLDDDLNGGLGIVEKPFTHDRLLEVLHYLHEGILDPPPSVAKPIGLKLGPAYEGIWA